MVYAANNKVADQNLHLHILKSIFAIPSLENMIALRDYVQIFKILARQI